MAFVFKEETHQYFLDGREIPGITAILQEFGFIDDSYYTAYHRELGKAVHACCHYLDEGTLDLDTVDPVAVGYVRAYEKAKAELGFTVTEMETARYSSIWLFAGRPDRDVILGGRPAIIEIKTGAFEKWHCLQTGAQEILFTGGRDRYSLHLRNDGDYTLRKHDYPNDRFIFQGLVQAHWWKRRNE